MDRCKRTKVYERFGVAEKVEGMNYCGGGVAKMIRFEVRVGMIGSNSIGSN